MGMEPCASGLNRPVPSRSWAESLSSRRIRLQIRLPSAPVSTRSKCTADWQIQDQVRCIIPSHASHPAARCCSISLAATFQCRVCAFSGILWLHWSLYWSARWGVDWSVDSLFLLFGFELHPHRPAVIHYLQIHQPATQSNSQDLRLGRKMRCQPRGPRSDLGRGFESRRMVAPWCLSVR